jgi:hypothetical protein
MEKNRNASQVSRNVLIESWTHTLLEMPEHFHQVFTRGVETSGFPNTNSIPCFK